jgi:hypothetical protein
MTVGVPDAGTSYRVSPRCPPPEAGPAPPRTCSRGRCPGVGGADRPVPTRRSDRGAAPRAAHRRPDERRGGPLGLDQRAARSPGHGTYPRACLVRAGRAARWSDRTGSTCRSFTRGTAPAAGPASCGLDERRGGPIGPDQRAVRSPGHGTCRRACQVRAGRAARRSARSGSACRSFTGAWHVPAGLPGAGRRAARRSDRAGSACRSFIGARHVHRGRVSSAGRAARRSDRAGSACRSFIGARHVPPGARLIGWTSGAAVR